MSRMVVTRKNGTGEVFNDLRSWEAKESVLVIVEGSTSYGHTRTTVIPWAEIWGMTVE